MTTSYDVETTGSAQQAPTYDSEGHQVWNPSVGIYHQPARVKRESYGGIVGALQDISAKSGYTVRSYPENFAGIIAAIKDLDIAGDSPGSDVGEQPPGGNIIINPITGLPEWNEINKPLNGDLWFDTRQGRLMVYVDDDWYQTNGADGLPIVTEDAKAPEVDHPVPGQFWWDAGNNDLFIHDGTYMLNGVIVDSTVTGAAPVWKLVSDSEGGNLQTTATLPLAVVGPRVTALEDFEYLPEIIVGERQMDVQKDYNEWVFEALKNLDEGLESFQPVLVGETPPPADEVQEGQLWYDTESLEMSIWYVDDDSSQWVPIHSAYSYDAELEEVTTSIAQETRIREEAIHSLHARISALDIDITDDKVITDLQTDLQALTDTVNALPVYNPTSYYGKEYIDGKFAEVAVAINSVDTEIPDLSPYALDSELQVLTNAVSNRATKEELSAVINTIPDVSNHATADYVTQSIANITTEYLPRTGGTLSGSFVMEKTSQDLAGFDFSTSPAYSKNALKFQAISPTGSSYSTFGTTNKFWEYAWNFEAEEDFCWIYNDTNKVFSITKEGPACSQLYIGDFSTNNSNGRVITNKIDVKERLTKYQTAFEGMRQAISSSTDYASLKSGLLTVLANV